MDRSPQFIGEAQASAQQACGTSSWNWGEQQGSAFAAQVQQVLGEDCLPDAEFFVRCWTEGEAGAADDFLSRHRLSQERQRQAPSVWNFAPFVPSFSAEEFVLCQQLQDSNAASSQAAVPVPPSLPEYDDAGSSWECEFENGDAITVERARRLLGVTADSTPAQIKSAYRHLVREYHPDRVEGSNSQVRQTANDRMIAINQAYCLLSAQALARA